MLLKGLWVGRDSAMLKGLHWRVKGAIFFLLALSLTSFVVTDFVLFNDVALKTIWSIDETGKFRELAAIAPHIVRSQIIAAHFERTDPTSVCTAQLQSVQPFACFAFCHG